MTVIIFAVVVLILLLILYYPSRGEHLTSTEEPPRWPEIPLFFPLPTTMNELTQEEQVESIEDMMRGDGGDDSGKSAEELKRENNYILNLPKSKDCKDEYDGCPVWAANGECSINPEYMLYKCASSCEACALNDQDKYNVTYIYNTRPPASCVYHGEDYPGIDRYIHNLMMLSP
jgi:hypothetical protein